jgi:sporulation protein YlmC with PRC-barrel domain
MASNQFENSRVSEGTLRPTPQDAATDREISDMMAEGGPAFPAGAMPTVKLGARGVSAASTLLGHRVLTAAGEELGNIEEIMLDLSNGRIAYAVLSFAGFPGIANKRFPVPWNALRIDPAEAILDIDRKTFEGAPDFDKDNWPDMADPAFGRAIHRHYGQPPYWEHTTGDAGIPSRGRREPASDRRAETRH